MWRRSSRTALLAAAVGLSLGLSACGAADSASPPGAVAGSTATPEAPGSVGASSAPTKAGTPVTPTKAGTPVVTPTPGRGGTTTQPERLAGATTRYVFPVGGCHASASQSHHDYPASDIFTKVGCQFVSPVDGRVDEVTRVDPWNPKTNVGRDRGGLSVSVVGVDGVRYYGSHLSAIAAGIEPGRQVRAGQVLGLTGKTGSARFTPAHLHFGISWPTSPGKWWIRRGAVAPQPFLTAWQQGKPASPATVVARAERAYGVDRGCRSYC